MSEFGDPPVFSVPRGGFRFPVPDPEAPGHIKFDQIIKDHIAPKAGMLLAAGGWCAPSEDIYKMSNQMTDREAREYWFEEWEKADKRARKAERKLRRLRKIFKETAK